MGGVIVALAVLMWLWAAVSLHAVRWLTAGLEWSRQGAWLGVLVAVGGVLLVLIMWLVLPASVLSQGWTRETLAQARQWGVMLVAAAAMAGWLRGLMLLKPSGLLPAKRAVASGKQKRRSS